MTYTKDNIEFQPKPTIHNFIDIEGQRFGRLIAVGIVGRGAKQCKWFCACDCGGSTIARSQDLRVGDVKSCGCWNMDILKQRNRTHGMSKTVTYDIWCGIIKRCNNPHVECFPKYGGRGIKVCPRWHKFENFLADMGERPSPIHSVERLDVNGDYCPDNCKWATPTEQANNKRNNHILTLNGRSQTLAQWAKELNVPYTRIILRLKRGWSVEDALTAPKHTKVMQRLTPLP